MLIMHLYAISAFFSHQAYHQSLHFQSLGQILDAIRRNLAYNAVAVFFFPELGYHPRIEDLKGHAPGLLQNRAAKLRVPRILFSEWPSSDKLHDREDEQRALTCSS